MNYPTLEESKVREAKKFACEYPGCGRLFKTKFSMKRHTFVHSEDKKYICKYCNKRFALPQYMREHMYTHTKDKPYICGVSGCLERFRQAGKLSLHRRTHPEYKLKQYDCQIQYQDSVLESPPPFLKNEDDPSLPPKEIFQIEHQSFSPTAKLLARRDSGQTVASRDEAGPPRKIDGKAGTEEAKPRNEAEILRQYLDLINSPLTLIMRPVLPIPERGLDRNKFSSPGIHSDVNFCDLFVKYAKES